MPGWNTSPGKPSQRPMSGMPTPDRPYPHPVRRRPARRIVRQTDRNGDHRLRPHRHGVLSATRHRSSDRRRMQCTGRTAIRRCSTGPPLTSTGLGTCRQNPRNRRCRTRRVARRGLRPDVGIPRRGMRSPPRRARARRFLPLEEVACQADILTFHTPLDDTTRHMAGAKLFERMKPGKASSSTLRAAR